MQHIYRVWNNTHKATLWARQLSHREKVSVITLVYDNEMRKQGEGSYVGVKCVGCEVVRLTSGPGEKLHPRAWGPWLLRPVRPSLVLPLIWRRPLTF